MSVIWDGEQRVVMDSVAQDDLEMCRDATMWPKSYLMKAAIRAVALLVMVGIGVVLGAGSASAAATGSVSARPSEQPARPEP